EAKALLSRRKEKDVGDRQERAHLILLAEKVDAIFEASLVGQTCRPVEIRAVANHEQVRVGARGDAREDLHNRRGALDRTKVRDVDQNLCGRVANQALAQRLGLNPMVYGAI